MADNGSALRPIMEMIERRLHSDFQDKRMIVGIAGPPGGGKSTLSGELVAALSRRRPDVKVALVPLDGFHFYRRQLADMPDPDWARLRRGSPFTFDVERFVQQLRALRRQGDGAALLFPSFDHGVGDPVEGAIAVAADVQLVLVEGNYLALDVPAGDGDATCGNADGWRQVLGQLDVCFFLRTPLPLVRAALVGRHMAAWQLTRAQAEQRIADNDLPNAELVVRCRSAAATVVDHCFDVSSEEWSTKEKEAAL